MTSRVARVAKVVGAVGGSTRLGIEGRVFRFRELRVLRMFRV